MQTYTKHIPKLTYVYITYANIYQTYTKINICLYNICKHIPNNHNSWISIDPYQIHKIIDRYQIHKIIIMKKHTHI